MTELLDKALKALEAARRLPADAQDDIARVVLEVAGSDDAEPVRLTPDERAALEISLAQAATIQSRPGKGTSFAVEAPVLPHRID